MHPKNGVGANLGHDRKERRHRGRGVGIGRGQPELHWEEGGFHRKDQHQQDRRHPDQGRILWRDLRDFRGKISDVQRAG